MLWNKSLPHGSLGIAFHSFVWNYSTVCWGGWKANKLAGQQSHIMYTKHVHKTFVIKLISRAFYRPLILLNRLAAFTFKETFCSDFIPNAKCINRNTHISIIKHSLFHSAICVLCVHDMVCSVFPSPTSLLWAAERESFPWELCGRSAPSLLLLFLLHTILKKKQGEQGT